MAVQGKSLTATSLPRSALLLTVAAAVAVSFSLAAAYIGLSQARSQPPQPSAAEELAARNQRIAFFEDRVAADEADFVSLNILAGQYLQRARETSDLADYGRADVAASRSLALLPDDNYQGTVALAAVRLSQHDFRAALELSERAVAIKPSRASGYGAKGDALSNLGRYAEAGLAYETMLELEPGLPALSRLAGLAFIEGDLLNAEDFWRQAIERSAGLPAENGAWARVQLGELYLGQGDTANAARQFRAALGSYPGFGMAEAGVASIRAAEGRLDDAILLYQGIVSHSPDLDDVVALGDLYTKAGLPREAAAQYELVFAFEERQRANGINPDLAIARFYAEQDLLPEEAVRLAAGAYTRAPNVYAADVYAWTLFKAGRLQEAEQLISAAMSQGTPVASFYFHAGMIRFKRGDSTGAAAFLEEALRLNPTFSLLQASRARETLARAQPGK